MTSNNQNSNSNNQNGTMSREEAGRKGGEATARNHDKEFFQEIGEKGGKNSGGNNYSNNN